MKLFLSVSELRAIRRKLIKSGKFPNGVAIIDRQLARKHVRRVVVEEPSK